MAGFEVIIYGRFWVIAEAIYVSGREIVHAAAHLATKEKAPGISIRRFASAQDDQVAAVRMHNRTTLGGLISVSTRL